MPTDVIMPRLGLTMEEGTVTAWRVKPGETVVSGQVLLEVETDKVTVEVEAQVEGVLGPVLVKAGERVAVGTLLARLYATGEQIGRDAELAGLDEVRQSAEPAVAEQKWIERRSDTTKVVTTIGRTFSSPRARKRSRETGVDWRQLAGSGPNGRVVERDVLRQAALQVDSISTAAQPVLPWVLSAEVSLAALLSLHSRLASFLAEEGREYSASAQVALVDWLCLVSVRVLAAPLGVGVMLVTPSGEILPIWDLEGADPSTLRQVAIARGRLSATATAVHKAHVLVADLSQRRTATVQVAPTPPQLAVITLGRLSEEKQSAIVTLTGDDRSLPWSKALELFDHLLAALEDPLELLT